MLVPCQCAMRLERLKITALINHVWSIYESLWRYSTPQCAQNMSPLHMATPHIHGKHWRWRADRGGVQDRISGVARGWERGNLARVQLFSGHNPKGDMSLTQYCCISATSLWLTWEHWPTWRNHPRCPRWSRGVRGMSNGGGGQWPL